MHAAIGMVGQLFGRLHLPLDGGLVIDLIGPVLMYAGDTATLRITVTDDTDARVDLTGADVELEVKPSLGGADPATIAKAIGTGITLLDQTDPLTRGQADVAIESADTDQPAGLYWLDVVVSISGGRVHAIAPREFTIAAVVNRP